VIEIESIKAAYKTAKKEIKDMKSSEGFMVITVSYDKDLVLPYRDGLAFMTAIINAEQLSGNYNDKRIKDFDNDTITARIMSYKDYERRKIAALLNVSYDDMKKYEFSEEPLPF